MTHEHTAPEPRIEVLTRPGCHLCEQALAIVAEVCAATGESYRERNIDDDPELRRTFTDQVPVTFVDGRQHDFWRVDAERLKRALRGRR